MILVNKDDSNSSPVVVPVPPHDLQSLDVVAAARPPLAGRLLPADAVTAAGVTPSVHTPTIAASASTVNTAAATSAALMTEKEQTNGSRISPGKSGRNMMTWNERQPVYKLREKTWASGRFPCQ